MGFKDIKYHILTCNVCHMIIISGREVQYVMASGCWDGESYNSRPCEQALA